MPKSNPYFRFRPKPKPKLTIESSVIVYNDGEIMVEISELSDGSASIGTISRKLNNKSTPEEFKVDLPVNQPFLDEMKQDPECWEMVQDAIKEGLESRK